MTFSRPGQTSERLGVRLAGGRRREAARGTAARNLFQTKEEVMQNFFSGSSHINKEVAGTLQIKRSSYSRLSASQWWMSELGVGRWAGSTLKAASKDG